MQERWFGAGTAVSKALAKIIRSLCAMYPRRQQLVLGYVPFLFWVALVARWCFGMRCHCAAKIQAFNVADFIHLNSALLISQSGSTLPKLRNRTKIRLAGIFDGAVWNWRWMRRKTRPSWVLFAAFECIDTDHFGRRLTARTTHENDEEKILASFFIIVIVSRCGAWGCRCLK